MSKYKRPNFDGDWWEEVADYISEHPEEGFTEDQVKEFIKYAVNKHMNTEDTIMTKKERQQMMEDLRSD